MFYYWEKSVDYLIYTLLDFDKTNHLASALHFFIFDTVKIFVLLITIIYLVIPEKPNKVPCLRALSQLFSYNIYYIIRPKVYISGRFR